MRSCGDLSALNWASSSSPKGLINLPVEILRKIFEYLEPLYLSRTMTLVCKRFAEIFNDDIYWKSIFNQIIPVETNNFNPKRSPYDIYLDNNHWHCGRDILWRDIAVQFNIVEKRWKINRSEILTQYYNSPHFASVDAIKIIGRGNTVISGGRDHMINVWKINMNTLELDQLLTDEQSHDGWVWDIDSCEPNTFYTCGWDNYVKCWSITDRLNKINMFNCKKPVTAVSCCPGLIAAGLHTPNIVLIDPRIGLIEKSASTSFKIHRHTITDVQILPEKNILLSISEDKCLSFSDLRFFTESYKTVTVTKENCFPTCLAQYRDLIYVGDSRGNVHIYSLIKDIAEILVFNAGTRLVTSIVSQLGAVTVGTTDRHVRIFYPSNPPLLIWDQQTVGEVTSVDQDRNILAVSSTSNDLRVYKPLNV